MITYNSAGMPCNYCFLCASNEGTFLDVGLKQNQHLCEKIETCLSVKIQERRIFSSKICHKCAYELDQCNVFLKKYKDSREVSNKAPRSQRLRCGFCAEPSKDGYIFDLTQDNHPNNDPLQKVHKLFDKNGNAVLPQPLLICLQCRYCLDVLYDLQILSEQVLNILKRVIDEGIDYSILPKIKTGVISRKTTETRPDRIEFETLSDSNSDSGAMVRAKKRKPQLNNNVTPPNIKKRTCDQCRNAVENSVDMYRFHRTGLTVCKSCWITIDPSRRDTKTRKLAKSVPEDAKDTKLCSVFLKDVLTNEEFKDERVYRIQKDDKGNQIYIITDESEPSDKDSSKSRSDGETVPRRTTKRTITKPTKYDSTDNETKVSHKKKTPNPVVPPPSTKRPRGVHSDTPNPETSHTENQGYNRTRNRTRLTSTSKIEPSKENHSGRELRKKSKVTSPSDTESDNKSTSNNKRKRKPITDIICISDAESDSKEPPVRTKRLKPLPSGKSEATARSLRRRNRSQSKEVSDESPIEETVEKEKSNNQPLTRTRNRSVSGSSKEAKSPPPVFKSPETSPKSSPISKSEPIKRKPTSSPSKPSENTLECSECSVVYQNKLIGMTHQLTHFKQLEIKLVKVPVPNALEFNDDDNDDDDDDGENTKDVVEAKENNGPVQDESQSQGKDDPIEEGNNDKVVIVEKPDDEIKLTSNEDPKETEKEIEKLPEEITIPEEVVENNDETNTSKPNDTNEISKDEDPSPQITQVSKETEDEDEDRPIIIETTDTNDTNTKTNVPEVTEEGTKDKQIEKEQDCEIESESDIRIVDSDSSSDSLPDEQLPPKETISSAICVNEETNHNGNNDDNSQIDKESNVDVCENNDSLLKNDQQLEKDETRKSLDESENIQQSVKTVDSDRNESTIDDSVNVARDILNEIFDLATDDPLENKSIMNRVQVEAETLEDISREISNNSADMPSLDPIVDNDQTLNRS